MNGQQGTFGEILWPNRSTVIESALGNPAMDEQSAKRSQEPGREYRFEHVRFTLVLQDMYFSRSVPRPGDKIPAFDLPTLSGVPLRSAELENTGPALLVFGSVTCPITDSAAAGLRNLYARFGDQVRFVMVNVREAHPGRSVPQPQTIEEKTEHAERLRGLHRFEFDIAIDDVDGTFHQALSPKPNSAYLVGKDGTILFRAHWANDERGVDRALAALIKGQAITRPTSDGLILPILKAMRFIPGVLDRAGSGAWSDMWRAVLPLAAVAWLIKFFGVSRSPS